MIILGLTGSIGMGKSTIAGMMEAQGIPVHDADACVHDLLSGVGGDAFRAVCAAFPYYGYPQIYGRKDKNGQRSLKRRALGEIIFHDADKRTQLEEILHPFVREAQTDFIRKNRSLGCGLVTLDIPLLFETGGENQVDFVLVASAPFHVQKQRVLERPGMTEEKFQAILERQMPDGEKCARADFVIETGLGRAYTMQRLKHILSEVKHSKK